MVNSMTARALASLVLLSLTFFPIACARRTSSLPVVPTSSSENEDPVIFRDITASSGISFAYRNGTEAGLLSILESLGGGVALLDFDGDGKLDIFLPGGGSFEGKEIQGRPCKLSQSRRRPIRGRQRSAAH
jgi:enediyne biosynthesis protein E4